MRTRLLIVSLVALVAAACGDGGNAMDEASPTDTGVLGAPTSQPSPTSPTADELRAPTPSPTSTPRTSPTVSIEDVSLALETVIDGLDNPLLVTAPDDDPRIWVAEQGGRVVVVDGNGSPRVFLDIRDRVTAGGERGLLGLAFHPGYADNGRVFVHYSGEDGRTVLSEFEASGQPEVLDPDSEQVLLTVPQPAANHNGGTVTFGPDGLLYLALGDGGGAGDQFDNAQDTDTLLGAILRLDVSTPGEYAIPPDNPFADGGGAPEVFSYGLRNPYRIAFGPDGTLYIADVGQNQVEEINALPLEEARGANFGWPILEGTICFRSDDCDKSEYVLPVVTYTHAETGGCSVIGGEVYTGELLPALRGHYFYSDLCAGFLRSIVVEDGELVAEFSWTEDVGRLGRVLEIGKGAGGELFVTEAEGAVRQIVPGE